MSWLWTFLRKPSNQRLLTWLGGGVVVIVSGMWAVGTYMVDVFDDFVFSFIDFVSSLAYYYIAVLCLCLSALFGTRAAKTTDHAIKVSFARLSLLFAVGLLPITLSVLVMVVAIVFCFTV
jgi:hypothetical protein